MKKKIKKYRRKRTVLMSTLVVLLLALGIGSLTYVYASLTDKDHVINSFGLSDLTGTIQEEFEPPTSTNPAKPGSTYKKEVTIKNQSSAPFFVRVLLTPEIQTTDGTLLEANIGKELTLDIQSKWLLGEDGYYYYLDKVVKETTPLFTSVTLSKTLDEKYKEASMSIQVKSETVSSAKFIYRQAWWNDRTLNEPNLMTIDTTLKNLAD